MRPVTAARGQARAGQPSNLGGWNVAAKTASARRPRQTNRPVVAVPIAARPRRQKGRGHPLQTGAAKRQKQC